MRKILYPVLGILVLSATVLIVAAAPGVRGTSGAEQGSMNIRTLEQTLDLKALPNGDLDPEIYR